MKYVCNVCGWVYDEDERGVKWDDLPEDFTCELCGVGKEDFSPPRIIVAALKKRRFCSGV